MAEQNVFEVPWGSESICYWCKKEGKCKLYTEDPRILTFKRLKREKPITIKGEVFIHRLIPDRKIYFSDLIMTGSLRGCPINEFYPNEEKLPKQFKGSRIVMRGR